MQRTNFLCHLHHHFRCRPIIFAFSTFTSLFAGMVYFNEQHTSNSELFIDRTNSNKKFPTDLADKLATKPYLTYHNSSPYNSFVSSTLNRKSPTWKDLNSGINSVGNYNDYSTEKMLFERPKGVPLSIRIISIDVPRLRNSFDGECSVNFSQVFPDGIARSKRPLQVPDELENSVNEKVTNTIKVNKPNPLEITQKSLARSLIRCRNINSKNIGIEVLELSIHNLNPHNIRKTYQLGSYRYDPGKYSRKKLETSLLKKNSFNNFDNKIETEGEVKKSVKVNVKDETDAPWNQYAWMEEMFLRINGYVPFGGTIERSPLWSFYLFSTVYKRTVPSDQSYFRCFLPQFLQKVGGDQGIDGDFESSKFKINRASSKPHVVIADGLSMQRVPGSLHFLTKCCKDANVPLFVINDPRVWGGNTHKDIESAIEDMRKLIKARIVRNALMIKEGGMFERGRLFGNIQANIRKRENDVSGKTRKMVQDAQNKLRRDREDDWSTLNFEELTKRMTKHKLIFKSMSGNIGDRQNVSYSESFVELCQSCLNNIEKNKKEEK